MNLFLVGTIIFVLVYLILNWFVKTSSKAIPPNVEINAGGQVVIKPVKKVIFF